MPPSRSPEDRGENPLPLVELPGSPRPGGQDDASFRIFTYGDRELWQPDAFIEWLAASEHPVYQACWRLIDLPCPRRELLELLISMYALPISDELAETSLRELREGMDLVRRGARGLRQSIACRLRLVTIPLLGFDVSTADRELRDVEAQFVAEGLLEDRAETLIRAQLTALAHVSTRYRHADAPKAQTAKDGQAWHDREVGSIAAVLLGRRAQDPAESQWQWRQRERNGAVVDDWVARYEAQLPTMRHTDQADGD